MATSPTMLMNTWRQRICVTTSQPQVARLTRPNSQPTDIFLGEGLFSKTIEQMSARDSSDTHLVMAEIFRAMDTKPDAREAAGIKPYARKFPYVNGQLFSGSTECPRFSKIARSYLLHISSLNWKKINPDIFGSMIQAVADDEERGALGMHYTSVPNILKVLNPLFIDDLREKLDEAGDSGRKLLNLRNRMAKIRVFDPACGSGNFLVIAYKESRARAAAEAWRSSSPYVTHRSPHAKAMSFGRTRAWKRGISASVFSPCQVAMSRLRLKRMSA